MLPSTGYFKSISCPFYDSGLCERPYCHFRHVKKDTQNTSSDGIESGTILQKLVSAAVQKVLQQKELTSASSSQITTEQNDLEVSAVNQTQLVGKATYNPTPISELNKINNSDVEKVEDAAEQKRKHIPVPYTPRKPANFPHKRKAETNGPSKPFIYNPPSAKYTPGCVEATQLDPYTPEGSCESKEKYEPGSEIELQEYTPKNEFQTSTTMRNYVPSNKNGSKKKRILEYTPAKLSSKKETPAFTYQPTLRSLVPCFSSDEDEPSPKKSKITNDLNGLDDLGPEFDILDQILDEEKLVQANREIMKSSDSTKTTETKKKCSDVLKEEKAVSNKSELKKSQEKTRTDKKEKVSDSKTESNSKSTSSSLKNHRSSNNKDKDEKNKVKTEKHKDEVEKHKDKAEKHKDKDEKHKDRDEKHKDKHEKQQDKHEKHKDKHEKQQDKHEKHKDKDEKHRNNKDKKHKDKDKKYDSKNSDKSAKYSKDDVSLYSGKNPKKSNNSINSSKRSSESEHKKSHKRSKESKSEHRKVKEKSVETHVMDNYVDNDMADSRDEDLCGSESDEETIALECKRIFEEYVPSKKVQKIEDIASNINPLNETEDNEYIPAKKRISRTVGKDIKIVSKQPAKPNHKANSAIIMAERLVKIREYHASVIKHDTSQIDSTVSKSDAFKKIGTPSVGNSKVRIAHVPYASTLLSAKKTISANVETPQKGEPSTSSTVIQTVKKGSHRVAHIPNEKFIDRPGVLEPLASKIPANIRSTYLNMMIDECLKIYINHNDAYARAQHEELATSKKCSTVSIYKNSAVMTISRLRKELQECNGIKKTSENCSALQKLPQSAVSKSDNAGSWSIVNKYKRVSENSKEFCGAKFYINIQRWVLTEQQLQDNGFPRPHPTGEKGRAIINALNKKKPQVGNIRNCCRCKKDYIVDKKGFAAVKEECIYHPNNKYRVRGEVKYQCCSQEGTSDGCCIAPSHVYEYIDYDNLRGYIRTLPPETEMDDYGVFSLDCEMCYTTHGLDLTRITVINSACKVVYETLIKPLHPIIDYNTRYSGITEEHMKNVNTTLLDVQATLLSMFNSNTILIGHSLESDFKALKLIHDTVIDTSVLFPHKMGPPYKRALRNLCSEHLKKIIQNSVEGHDSAEDATVCMELIIYKLKEYLKTR